MYTQRTATPLFLSQRIRPPPSRQSSQARPHQRKRAPGGISAAGAHGALRRSCAGSPQRARAAAPAVLPARVARRRRWWRRGHCRASAHVRAPTWAVGIGSKRSRSRHTAATSRPQEHRRRQAGGAAPVAPTANVAPTAREAPTASWLCEGIRVLGTRPSVGRCQPSASLLPTFCSRAPTGTAESQAGLASRIARQ